MEAMITIEEPALMRNGLRSRIIRLMRGYSLNMLVQYSHLLDQAGLIEEEDVKKSFKERCLDNIETLCAVGVIVSLRFGVQTPFTPSYLIAISGGAALVQQRYIQ